MSDPTVTYIPVNSTFTTVNNIAGQIPEVDAAVLDAVNLTTENITVNKSLNQTNVFPGLGTLKQIVGYVPNDQNESVRFNNLAAGNGLFLNKVPAAAAAKVLDAPQLLILPKDSIVVGARVTNNGGANVNAGTYDIGIQAFTTGAPTAKNLFADVPAASVNAAGGALVGGAASQDTLGTAGVLQNGVGPTTLLNDKVSVLVKGLNNTAGDMAVAIDYIQP